MNVKLLGPASFRAFRCRWMLEELGIPYESVFAMPQSEEVRKYNPLGKIPILIIDDLEQNYTSNNNNNNNNKSFVMYESTAINTFLGDWFRSNSETTTTTTTAAAARTLVPPPGTRQRGLYEQTISVLTTELDAQGLWIHRKHEALGHLFTHIPEAVHHAKAYFHKTNRTLRQQVQDSNGPYLLGEDFTAADIVYVHCLDWSSGIGWDDKWKEDPILVEYLDRCKNRTSYQKISAQRRDEQPLIEKAMKRFKGKSSSGGRGGSSTNVSSNL